MCSRLLLVRDQCVRTGGEGSQSRLGKCETAVRALGIARTVEITTLRTSHVTHSSQGAYGMNWPAEKM